MAGYERFGDSCCDFIEKAGEALPMRRSAPVEHIVIIVRNGQMSVCVMTDPEQESPNRSDGSEVLRPR
jgi:hypothetical protein